MPAHGVVFLSISMISSLMSLSPDDDALVETSTSTDRPNVLWQTLTLTNRNLRNLIDELEPKPKINNNDTDTVN